MNKAFILVMTELGAEEEISRSLKEIVEVEEVYNIYGIYNFIVKVIAESKPELKNTIITKIRSIKNVRSVLTLIVAD